MISGQKCSPEAELVAGKFGNPTLLTMYKNEINTRFFNRYFHVAFIVRRILTTKPLFTQLKILTVLNFHGHMTTNEISKVIFCSKTPSTIYKSIEMSTRNNKNLIIRAIFCYKV